MLQQYLDEVILNAVRQLLGGFGLVFVLAFLMWTILRKIF